jgi:uncharacterized protein (TIGR01244 family)
MPDIVHITPTYAVAGSLGKGDFAEVAKLGFAAVVNNRPDGEQWGQLASDAAAAHAAAAGLAYGYAPATGATLFTPAVVRTHAAALDAATGPVLAYCKSGMRSSLLWAAVEVSRGTSVDDVLSKLAAAGLNGEIARDSLEELAKGAGQS